MGQWLLCFTDIKSIKALVWFGLDHIGLTHKILMIQITSAWLQSNYTGPSALNRSLVTSLRLRQNLLNKTLTRTWGFEESRTFLPSSVPRLLEKPPCVGSALEGEHMQAGNGSPGLLVQWKDILQWRGGGGKVSRVASCVTKSPSCGATKPAWWLVVTCGRSNASARPLDPVSGSSGIVKGGGGARKVAGISGGSFVSRSRPQTSPPEGSVTLMREVEGAREEPCWKCLCSSF